MAGETIQQAAGKLGSFESVGTGVASAPAALPIDPALPGLARLSCPEEFLATLTPFLRNRLGNQAELTYNSLSVRRYVPGKRCIVKFEATVCSAPGMPGKHQRFFLKFYTGGHGAVVYHNCRELWRRGFSRGRFTIAEPFAYHHVLRQN